MANKMTTLRGKISEVHEIEIKKHSEGYLTRFVLNTGTREIQVLFKDRILIDGKVEVTGNLTSVNKMKASLDRREGSTIENLILMTVQDLSLGQFTESNIRTEKSSDEPFILAATILDVAKKVRYIDQSLLS